MHCRLNASDDAFHVEAPELIERLRAESISDAETKSWALFVVARLRGVRAAMICAASSNLVEGASLYSPSKLDPSHSHRARMGPRDATGVEF